MNNYQENSKRTIFNDSNVGTNESFTSDKQVLKVTEQELTPITVNDITYHCLPTGHAGYFVATTGDIISYHTRGHLTPSGKLRSSKPRLLKPYKTSIGYYQVSLCNKERSAHKQEYVHRIVASAFLQRPDINPSKKLQVNHIDGNKANNAVSNLEFCTHLENSIHYQEVLKRLSSAKKTK